MKYSRGIGAGIGALAGGGLGYLATNKIAQGKKDDFIEGILRKYPGMTKTAAEEIYKQEKRKRLLAGTIGGAMAGASAGLLIGNEFRRKSQLKQRQQPQNHPPVQTQPIKKESPLSELNGLSNSEKRINEASNDLDSHKVNVGKNIVERHNDAANKINEAMDRIKKNGERINKTNKTQADVDRIIKENNRAMGIGGDNNDVTLDTSNIKETKNTKILDDLIKRMGGNPKKKEKTTVEVI
nr:MAG TPA: YtxH-like protein [Bacteriophage sp.]